MQVLRVYNILHCLMSARWHLEIKSYFLSSHFYPTFFYIYFFISFLFILSLKNNILSLSKDIIGVTK